MLEDMWVEEVATATTYNRVRPATLEELNDCRYRHFDGKCPHTIIRDIDGFAYYIRTCVVCGAHIGLI